MPSPTSQNTTRSPDSLPSNDSSTPPSNSSSLSPSSPSSNSSSLSPSSPSSNSSSSSPSISVSSPQSDGSPPSDGSPRFNESLTSNSPSSKGSSSAPNAFFAPPPPESQKKPPLSQSPPQLSSSEGEGKTSNSPADSNRGGSSSNSQNLTISLPAVAGIVGGFLVLIIILIILSCVGKKKKKNPHNATQYYADPSTRIGGNYYVGGRPPKWGNQDHGAPSPLGGGWNAPPVPMASNDDMSSVFSGPHAPLPPPSPVIALGFNKSTFTYEELAAATNGFIQANLLGQGGFGYVHKGVLPNGKEIAVKSLKSGSGQGEREFHAEVDIISRVHHRHLVSLVGYCIAGSKRLLVYDFVPNKTLEYHLHGKGLPTMDWPTRLKIALGSAKGLAYLHEDCHPRIIHRDIKSANILLDFKFEALVADFGLAKLSSDNHTHVSTRVMGTFGYLAPEYASSGKLTEKSDVFSYGVMLLELITGRRPCETFMDDSLVDWARPVLSEALTDGNYDELVDPNLKGNYDPVEMARMVASAAASVRHSARRRPKMSQIVHALEGDVSLEDLNEGMRPGQSMLFSSGSDYDSDRYSKKKARKAPVASPEYSDELSEPIGEYGLHHVGSSSSEGLFSDEFNPMGNQRLKGFPQL